jgi:hypothetical protein
MKHASPSSVIPFIPVLGSFEKESRRMAGSQILQLSRLKDCGLNYEGLKSYRRVGQRRGAWAQLTEVEKALYRCGLWVARVRGSITSIKLSACIAGIVAKLMARIRTRICALGIARARTLWDEYRLAGVFDWAPELRPLLSRSGYIMYLGVMEFNG